MHHISSPNSEAYSFSPGKPTTRIESPSSPTSELTIYQQTPHPRSEAAFICTICWQQQPSGSKPKLLGTSARIVCRACWRAVLDLSICWVCGECIVRGDEVVSLGWCFWHKVCFGCLVCRTRMSVPGSENGNVIDQDASLKVRRRGEKGAWDDSRDAGHGRRSGVGVELNTIPLCNVCCVETAGESRDQVLERGLESVTMFDGGLSRDRLDMLSEGSDGPITLAPKFLTRNRRRLRGATDIEQDLKTYINISSGRYTNGFLPPEDLSSLLDNAADLGISNGDIDNQQRHPARAMNNSNESKQEKERRPDAYVSVFDPVGEPAFKPSKTKPLPKWMHLLPNNVHREREQKANAALEDESLQCPGLDSPIAGRDSGSSDSPADFKGSPIAPVDIPSLRGGGQVVGSPTLPMTIPDKSHKTRKFRVISFDPKTVTETTNGNDDHRCYQRAQTTDSVYITPPEYPSCHPPPPKRRTPYLQESACLPSAQKNDNSCFPQSNSFSIIEEPVEEPCCELGVTLQSPKARQEDTLSPDGIRRQTPLKGCSAFLSSSLGYLDKYQPRRYDAKKQINTTPEAERIIYKIKGQKARMHNTPNGDEDEMKETRGNRGKRLRLGSEEYGIDPRREDLLKELRNLFCEE